MIQKIADLITKPYRATYKPEKDLGPSTFLIDNEHTGKRVDFQVINRRNKTLQCSIFHRDIEKAKKYPLMVYCHGNTGNRTSSYGAVYSMLRSKVNVLAFDFAGCGLSEGDTISLGHFEQHDISDVLDYAIKHFEFIDPNRIAIWGRCMGAVSTIKFAARTHSISFLILDSPFPDFPTLIRDYIQRAKIIPKWAEDYIYDNVRNKVKEQANFDFEEVSAITHVSKCRVPAFFLHGNRDGVIPIQYFKKIYEAYPAAKEFLELKTSHNDPRPEHAYEAITNFVKSKFFTPVVYGRFEPTPKKANSRAKPVVLPANSLMSLDTLKFNEIIGENEQEEMKGPFSQVLESFRTSKTQDLLAQSLENKELPGKNTSKSLKREFHKSLSITSEERFGNAGVFEGNTLFIPPSLERGKSATDIRVASRQIFDKNKLKHDAIWEESEGDISEDLLDSGQVSNKDYLETSYIDCAAKSTFDSFRRKKMFATTKFSSSNY